jgi:hypothetical protein
MFTVKTDVLMSQNPAKLGEMLDTKNGAEMELATSYGSDCCSVWKIAGPISYAHGWYIMPIQKGV